MVRCQIHYLLGLPTVIFHRIFVSLINIQFIRMENTKQVILRQTLHGKVFKCVTCKLIHIEFKNLNFNFSDSQYTRFAAYMKGLDGEHWEYTNRDSSYSRKILIPIGYQNINILFNSQELAEFKDLLQVQLVHRSYTLSIETSHADFTLFLN